MHRDIAQTSDLLHSTNMGSHVQSNGKFEVVTYIVKMGYDDDALIEHSRRTPMEVCYAVGKYWG